MNKREKLTFTVVAVLAMTVGVVIGLNIDSVATSPSISKTESSVSSKAEICASLESLPHFYANARYSLSDREAFYYYRGSEGITEPATVWTSTLNNEGKAAFQEVHNSAQTVAWDVFNFSVIRDESWDTLKTSLRRAFKYCSLDMATIAQNLGD